MKGFPRVKSIHTSSLPTYFSNLPPCEIAIEATGGVNPYAQPVGRSGSLLFMIINPNKFRGIGISGKKTDERDAKALNTFLRLNPDSGEVHLRSLSSRELKSLLVSRELVVNTRVSLTNHIRGILRESGITLPVGCSSFWDRALGAISTLKNPFIKSTLEELYKQAAALKLEEKAITQRIEFLTQNNESVKRLRTLPGVGLLTAAAMIDGCR